MNTYKELDKVGKSYGDRNFCSVISVAIACNVSFEIAHNAMEHAGREFGKGAHPAQLETALNLLGYYTSRKAPRHEYATGQGCVWDKYEDRYVLKYKYGTTGNNNIPSKGTFIVTTNQHVLTMRDGVIEDFTDNRKFRIKSIHEVTKMKKSQRPFNVSFSGKVNTPAVKPRVKRKPKFEWVIKHSLGERRYGRITKVIKQALAHYGQLQAHVPYRAELYINGKPETVTITKDRARNKKTFC